jgi:hypothetical protein
MSDKHPVHNVSEGRPEISEKEADVTYNLIKAAGDHVTALDPPAERRLRRKLYFFLAPLLIVINLMLFVR